MTDGAANDYDKESVDKLKTLMGKEYPRLVANLLKNTEENIDAIGVALRANDLKTAMAKAHKMKSACGQFGLLQLQNLTKQIEYFEGPNNAALMNLHMQLKPAFVRASEFLRLNGLE